MNFPMNPSLTSVCFRSRSRSVVWYAYAIAFASMTFGAVTPARAEANLTRTSAPVAAAKQTAASFMMVKQVDGKTFFEIPASILNRDLLWYVERGSVSTTIFEGAGKGSASLMIRLQRRGNEILIRNLTPGLSRRALPMPSTPGESPSSEEKVPPIVRSVQESSLAPILTILPVAAGSTAEKAVIDVSDLFRRNLPELGLQSVMPGAAVDPARSYIDSVKSFPTNLLITAFVTGQPVAGGDTLAALVKHSWILLPEVPMKARPFDNRVGLFNIEYEEYAEDANTSVPTKSIVRRYRLEKKDPNAAISEPVKPIVYYIGRTVPEKWRPYIKQAIEDWNVAFETAGFRNAIVAKVAPSEAEDPDWDPSDTRFSVIRWVANPIVNAIGPNIADPRSGEILSAHILIWENVLQLANTWYYNMCSAVDPRAQSLPLNDELTGRMMRYIVAHEVGHTLGLRHNHRASTAYTVAQLRDPEFTAKYGSTASIMAYGRMNYVAQPGDGVAPESLMPRVGPYDLHAIRWSYAQLPAAEEAKTLDAWASESYTNPWLVYGGEDFSAMSDPQVQMQNVGKERVEATRLGLANLKIAMTNLSSSYQKGNSTWSGLYDAWIAGLRTRNDYLQSVIKEIGGREERRSTVPREPQFVVVPADRQRQALDYILTEGLHLDPVYYSAGVQTNVMPFNTSNDLRRYQGALLVGLFDPMRLININDVALDQEDGPAPMGLGEYFDRIAAGVFEEAESGAVPSLLRRSTQRDFFTLVARQRQANPTEDSEFFRQMGAPDFVVEAMSSTLGTDTLAALRAALTKLETRLERAASRAKDPLVKAHWQQCLLETRKLLGK